MLTKEDLIYFGAILIWQSSALGGTKDNAVEAARDFYNKIFKEDE